MFTDEIPSHSFCRRWVKADSIGALKYWNSTLKEGWIQMYSLDKKCYTRFSVQICYEELDKSDLLFIKYFLNNTRTHYKGPTKMIAFYSPDITITETDVHSIIIFQIKNIFIINGNQPLANNSNITFKYDIKKDTISTIFTEFAKDFLEDTSSISLNFCKKMGKEISKVFHKWMLSKSDDEIETIVI